MTAIPSLTPYTDATNTAIEQLRVAVAPHLSRGGGAAVYARMLVPLHEAVGLVLAREHDAGVSWAAMRKPFTFAMGEAMASAFDKLIDDAVEGQLGEVARADFESFFSDIAEKAWSTVVDMQKGDGATISVDVVRAPASRA